MPQPLKNPLKKIELNSELIAENLQTIRQKRGLTQTEIAEIVGITRESIAAYESGRVRLSDDMVIRFALAYKVSSDQILGLSIEQKEDIPAMRIMRRVRLIEKLPIAKQKALLQTIDGFLKGEGI